MGLKRWHKATERVTNDTKMAETDSTLLSPQFVKLHVLEFRQGICVPTLTGPLKRQAGLSLKLHVAGCMQLVGGELNS